MVANLKPLLVFRADGDDTLGAGHVMRCLALAEAAAAQGCRAIFAAARLAPRLEAKIVAAGFSCQRIATGLHETAEARLVVEIAEANDAAWIILDGYRFTSAYQQRLQDCGRQLLVIDDLAHLQRYHADAVLNSGFRAASLDYHGQPHTLRWFGPEFALVQPRLANCRNHPRAPGQQPSRILVTLGGADPVNASERVIAALARLDASELTVKVVVGPANRHLARLQSAVAGSSDRFELVIDPPEMGNLMAWADVAITAAGSTVWELTCLGVPSLAIIVADNQIDLAAAMDQRGAMRSLGWIHELSVSRLSEEIATFLADAPARAIMSARAAELVDGQGTARVVANLLRHTVRLRAVAASDAELLYAWFNDPQTRRMSFSTDRVESGDHLSWFAAQLDNPACRIFVAEDARGTPIGQTRYEICGNKAVLAVSVASIARGLGYGQRLIAVSARRLFFSTSVDEIQAFVKPENEASACALAKAGYRHAGDTTFRDQPAQRWVLDKDAW